MAHSREHSPLGGVIVDRAPERAPLSKGREAWRGMRLGTGWWLLPSAVIGAFLWWQIIAGLLGLIF
ncbi:hypothetical protein AB9K41_18990, partial [Cribrihabitans sp. XS_ASV171]